MIFFLYHSKDIEDVEDVEEDDEDVEQGFTSRLKQIPLSDVVMMFNTMSAFDYNFSQTFLKVLVDC